MTMIHTFQLNQGGFEKRTSENRAYKACLVATVTEAALKSLETKLAETKAQLTTVRETLSRLLAEKGCSREQALDRFQAELDGPMNGKGWYKVLWEESDAVAVEMGVADGTRYLKRWEIEAEAKARLEARGIPDPYRKDGYAEIGSLDSKIRAGEYSLVGLTKDAATWKVGDQRVLSWHLSVSNAQKALSSRDAVAYQKRGFDVQVSTKIETRETKKRVKIQAS